MKRAFATTFLDIETADDPEVGLQNRDSMGDNDAMLLDFDTTGFHSIWMKDTEIPLDIVFLSDSGEVVAIEHGEPHSQEKMTHRCASVLELKQGRADDLDITVGDDLSSLDV